MTHWWKKYGRGVREVNVITLGNLNFLNPEVKATNIGTSTQYSKRNEKKRKGQRIYCCKIQNDHTCCTYVGKKQHLKYRIK